MEKQETENWNRHGNGWWKRKRTAEMEIPKQLSHSAVVCLNQLLV